MICPKCGTTLEDTSIVCMQCKAFVLPNIPRKDTPEAQATPLESNTNTSNATDMFGNLVNFVKSENSSAPSAEATVLPKEKIEMKDFGQEIHPEIDLNKIELSQSQPRKTSMPRFGDESVDLGAPEQAPEPVFTEPERPQPVFNDPVPESGMSTPEPQSPQPQPKKKWPLIVIGAAITISMGLAAFFYLSGA